MTTNGKGGQTGHTRSRASRVAKARERLDSMLASMNLSGYRADGIRACAEDLADERVRETIIIAIGGAD